jgi:hypothetical protein
LPPSASAGGPHDQASESGSSNGSDAIRKAYQGSSRSHRNDAANHQNRSPALTVPNRHQLFKVTNWQQSGQLSLGVSVSDREEHVRQTFQGFIPVGPVKPERLLPDRSCDQIGMVS